jgi:hypothetical protein
MKIGIFARERHHKVHAQAIADGLGVVVKDNLSDIDEDIVCVFSYGDLKLIDELGKYIIFCEHGVGMYYNNAHPSYAGSLTKREKVILRLSPNENHAQKERETLECPVEVIGVPKLDKYANKYWDFNKEKPTVAISFHFDCFVNPETRSSFFHFQKIIPELKKHFNLLGHAHPRLMRDIEGFYIKNKIRVIKDFDDVIRLADVYVIDNSSTIFEWCITNKPIVLLNPPFYRREVEHKGNPRFWKHSGIAPLCDKPEDLIASIWEAVNNHDKYLPKIREAEKDVLTFTDGKCAERAVQAIKKHIQQYE